MGTYGNGDDLGKRKKRGSTNNTGRLSAFANAKGTGNADWGGASAEWLAAVIVAITCRGGACTFALSRDGGAYGLRLMLDGDFTQLWFNGDADLQAELEKVFVMLDAMPE